MFDVKVTHHLLRLLLEGDEGGPEVVGAGGAGVLPGVLHLAARLVHLRQVEPTDRRVIPGVRGEYLSFRAEKTTYRVVLLNSPP